MRLFVALDLEPAIRDHLARFLDGVRGFAPDVHWVPAESLHITLKFIGEFTDEKIPQLTAALKAVKAAPATLSIHGLGFFPNPRAPRVFWIGIEADSALAALAQVVDEATERLGVPREKRAFTPHLTLARSGSGNPRRKPGDGPNPRFDRLRDKLQAVTPPDFGTMTAREFYLYQSKLGRGGSVYTKLERFALG